MGIEDLRKYQRRHPKGSYFLDLRSDQRQIARSRLNKSLARARSRGKPITPQRLGAIVASAARISRMTAAELSAQGRRMRATQGGYARQRRCRARGINPTLKATLVRLARGGHIESARRFYNGQRAEESDQFAAAIGCRQSQVANPLRPGAPPLTVTVGRATGNVPAFWKRARTNLEPIP